VLSTTIGTFDIVILLLQIYYLNYII